MKIFLRQLFLTFTLIAICFQVNAATVTWDGGAGTTNWTDAMNWDTDALPTASDDVAIDTTVNLTASTQVQRVLLNGNAVFTISAGVTLTIDGFAGGDDGLEVQNSATVINNGTIAISNIDVGDTNADGLYNKGMFTNNGTITIDGTGQHGLYLQQGTFTNNAGKTITITNVGQGDSGADYVYMDDNSGTIANFHNYGDLDIVMTGNDDGIYIKDGSVLTNHSTGTINISSTGGGDMSLHIVGNSSIPTPSTLDNAGTFTINGNGTTDYGIQIDGANTSTTATTTAILINSGTLNVNDAGDNTSDDGIRIRRSGMMTNNAGGVVNINNAKDEGIQIEDANYSTSVLNNSGTINISGAADHGMENFGTFNNMMGGTYKAINSGDDGIRMRNTGAFNNDGAIIISGSGSEDIETDADQGTTFTNTANATFAPGDNGIGLMEIKDDFDLGTATVTFEIGDTTPGSFDQIQNFSAGTAMTTSNATMHLDWGTYVPAVGDKFKVIDGSGDVMGSFGTVTSSNSDITFTVTNDTTELEVEVTGVVNSNMVNITFELNVATLGANVSSTGMYIGGGSGFGGPSDNVMTDQGNGIWSVTFQKPAGFNSHYTFINGDGGWNDKEQLGGLPCSDPNNFNDRFLPWVSQDTTIKACFGTCDSDGSCTIVTDSVDITFMVNTSNIIVDPTGMFIAGGGNGNFGNPGDNAMSDMNGDGVYEFTVRKAKGFSSNYTFTNGNSGWGAKEQIAGLPCADPSSFNDRFLPNVLTDTTLMTCFETCSPDTTCFTAPPVQTKPDLPITFEDTVGIDYNFADFGGTYASPSMVVVDPTDPTNLVAQTTKPANSETWAGTVLGGDGLINAIPFTAANQKMYVDVWSPAANTPILLKVEDAADGNIAAEVLATTTTASTWETLEFDLANSSTNAIDLANTYNKIAIFYNFGTAGADVTYYCDNVSYGSPYTSTNGLEVDNNLFTVQPNLVRDYVNITFGENAINTEKQLTVVNAIGQVIENRTINNDGVYTLDATRYANGLYFVSIRTENAILTQKFVVSK